VGTDRRRDAATALTGATLLGAGGGLRHAGITAAIRYRVGREPVSADYPRVHLSALKATPKGRKLYLAGTAAGLVGTAGLGTGVLNLTRRKDVGKRHDRTPLWQEGVAGTADALRDRKDSLRTKAPAHARGTQLAIAAGSGAGGSALARLAMRGASGKAKALVSPIAGALAATASVPASNRAVQRSTKGEYVVTPTGVRRAKDVIKKPSSKARQVSSRYGPMRQQVVPTDMGKRDSYRVQRAKITAAGSTPLVGPYAQAHLASHYAPKGHKAEAGARQIAYGPAAGMAAGVGAAYGGAALARHVAPVGTKAEQALQWRSDKINDVRRRVGLGPSKPAAEGSRRARVVSRAKANRLAKPLMHNRGTAAAAAVGFLGARAAVGGTGTQLAISRNQRDQSRLSKGVITTPLTEQFAERVASTRRAFHAANQATREAGQRGRRLGPTPVRQMRTERTVGQISSENRAALKAAKGRVKTGQVELDAFRAKNAHILKLDAGGQTKREKHKLADTKRLNAALATTAGTAGLASLGLLATRHKAKAVPLSIVGSGIGGANALIGARVQRHEAKAIDPVKKALPIIPLGNIPRDAIHSSHGKVRILEYHGENRFTVLDRHDNKRLVHREHLTFIKKAYVGKSLVPGQGYKRAINLSHAERAAVRSTAGTGPRGDLLRRGTSPANNAINRTFATLHNASQGAETGPKRNVLFAAGEFPDEHKQMISDALPRKVKRPMVVHGAPHLPVGSGMGFPAAGTRRPSHVLVHTNDMSVITHEAAHAMPRRNGARIGGMNQLQRAREEGRADATAMRHHGQTDVTHGDYDSLARIRRQADAGEEGSRKALGQVHAALPQRLAAGQTGLTGTYQTRAQTREYTAMRSKLGRPVGPKPFVIGVGKSAGGQDNDLIRRYGDRGPLPKNIDRDERMRAYEARYHAHGGKKGEKWQRRANVSEGARNVALATGTAALAGLAHLKTKRGIALGAKHPNLHRRLDHLALTSGAAGGAAELAGEYSRNRRASYASSPGGVAASALTRMRANTPKESS
jgi:hypothetical protein